jgi:hypothetical protein
MARCGGIYETMCLVSVGTQLAFRDGFSRPPGFELAGGHRIADGHFLLELHDAHVALMAVCTVRFPVLIEGTLGPFAGRMG